MLTRLCVAIPLVFLASLFILGLWMEQQHASTNTVSNSTVWPTQPGREFDALPLTRLKTLLRLRRESKPSRKDRKKMAKYSITTTKRTRTNKFTTSKKRLKPGKSPKRAYTLDIHSEDYSAKKYGNASVNAAQYAYEIRMSASREVKSIFVKDIRKQFFNITAHRSKLSQLEILRNQSKVLYDNYMKIINKSTTINYWRRLRDARYNNTSPNIDLLSTLEELYKDWNVYGGTTGPIDPMTVAESRVQYYKTLVVDMLSRIPPGPVQYKAEDVLGASGMVDF